MLDKQAKWIWIDKTATADEYACFTGEFIYSSGKATFSICAETDYILYINGAVAGFSQFAGYPFHKYCDELDITELCLPEKNTFSVTVRYEGVNSATHIDDGAGVIFSLDIDGKTELFSSKDTLGGLDTGYIQHQARTITSQLGLSSGMCVGDKTELASCREVEKTYNITQRPVKKAELQEYIEALPTDKIGIHDLGREVAGYLKIKVRASDTALIKVAYGEHLAEGTVRQIIGARDFSLDFKTDRGEYEFLQLFVRISARYLQVFAPEGVEVVSIGVIPSLYPLTEKEYMGSGLDRDIYSTCVRTLRLCMNSHYEDCPWREQALYVLDSRNQMLCGYYAFKETEFQRENLLFIAQGTRQDGFLELTYPAINTPAIPFFSIMYPVAVYEYIAHTGDKTVLKDTMKTISVYMNKLIASIGDDGLINEFASPYWNFYEWSEGSSGEGAPDRHLILNCSFVYSCEYYKKLCEMADIDLDVDTEKIKRAIEREFFDAQRGVFSLYPKKSLCSQLGNAFALLIGLGDERTVDALKQDTTLIPATLSMLGFIYDALILRDTDAKEYILKDIRQKYGYMLSCGATSFWETIKGESDFDNAGSLCHGWSAIPIYYYNVLNNQ